MDENKTNELNKALSGIWDSLTDEQKEKAKACKTTDELMLLAGKETVLAGDLILDRYLHEVVLGMARRRWDDAVNMGVRTLVTADTAEYLALSATKPKGVRVITLEEAVAECL